MNDSKKDREVITRERLASDIRKLGLDTGDWVAVHSSMKSIGWVEGGPVTVIEAFREVVGDDGGIMMPSFIMPQEQQIDLAVTPSYLGLLPETFRKYPGVVRSAHPTHSVAIMGPGAEEIAEAHRRTSYIGRGSPWEHLADKDGWVLHVGCDWSSSSILHLAEVIARVPYLNVAYPAWSKGVTARHTDGTLLKDVAREVPGDSAQFVLVQREMKRRGMLREGRVGQADSVMARARDMLDVAVEMMKEDPAQFLCNFDDCQVCPPSRELLAELERKKKGED